MFELKFPARLFLFQSLFFLTLISCQGNSESSKIEVRSDFESGSIGEVSRLSDTILKLNIRDDNENDQLPDTWRNWWYFRLSNLPTKEEITLSIGNRGWNNFYLPVYSYDNVNWQRVPEENVSLSSECEQGVLNCSLIIKMRFEKDSVYLARYYPYSYQKLQEYLARIESSNFVRRTVIGDSPMLNRAIELLEISNPDLKPKYIIWLHARTHPAETGGSFFIEGLVDRLLQDFNQTPELASNFAFYIVPMHNIDGVILGNYRTNAESINLETTWFIAEGNLQMLSTQAPLENQILQMAMRETFFSRINEAPILAINLHSANTDISSSAFAFTHFGQNAEEYSGEEIELWQRQIELIELINNNYPAGLDVAGGGVEFLNFAFPETWWWHFAGSQSIALTLETTYSKAGFDHWATEDDIRLLGSAFVQAVYQFYMPGQFARNKQGSKARKLKSSNQYSEVELKH